MVNYVNIASQRETSIRQYNNFLGMDVSLTPSMCSTQRSPDCLNVYKNYTASSFSAIETRPGYTEITNFGYRIYGMFLYENKLLVHSGNYLSIWNNFPDTPSQSDITQLSNEMNETDSVAVNFSGELFILDKTDFYVYSQNTLNKVCQKAYVPLTRINADPNGANGVSYQSVNLLSPLRENSFTGDGVATDYHLDAVSLDSIADYRMQAWVGGEELTEDTDFSVNRLTGVVSFTNPPAESVKGSDNVKIRFSKTVSGYSEKITKCTVMSVFDNRLFLTGNPTQKAKVFHSELSNPYYFRDDAWYDDGSDESAIVGLSVLNGTLLAVKDFNGEEAKVYSHTPSLDYEMGKVYPVEPLNITVGAIGNVVNFFSDTLYLSPMGLEAIRLKDGGSYIKHLSARIDKMLKSENNYDNARVCVWKNYLVILISGVMYLADGYAGSVTANGESVEWYRWNHIGIDVDNEFMPALNIKCINENLYFGCSNGSVCQFTGTNDNGQAITSYWSTPEDTFNEMSRYKKTMKTGCAVQMKRITNSMMKIAAKTDLESFEDVLTIRTAGFRFDDVDFSLFSFGTGIMGIVSFDPSKKKFKTLSLKIYSDVLNKPFGIYSIDIRAMKKNFIKPN